MYKKTILSLLICAMASMEAMAMSLSGTTTRLADGTQLYLCIAFMPNAEEAVVDSCIVSHGAFKLSHQAQGMMVYKVKKDLDDRLEQQQLFAALPDDKVTVADGAVRGASGQDQFRRVVLGTVKSYETGLQAVKQRHKAVLDSMINHRDQVLKIVQGPEFEAMQRDQWQYDREQQQVYRKIYTANADNIFGIVLLQQDPLFLPATTAMYDELSDEVKASPYGQAFKTVCMSMVKGATAPDATATDLEGNSRSLKSLLQGKKLLLVDFWASWCVPCRRSIPKIKAIYDRYHDRGLAVVSLSTDKVDKAWRKAVAEEQMPWTQLRCDEAVKKAFDVSYIPSVFLINDKGEVLVDHLFGNYLTFELEAAIEQTLGGDGSSTGGQMTWDELQQQLKAPKDAYAGIEKKMMEWFNDYRLSRKPGQKGMSAADSLTMQSFRDQMEEQDNIARSIYRRFILSNLNDTLAAKSLRKAFSEVTLADSSLALARRIIADAGPVMKARQEYIDFATYIDGRSRFRVGVPYTDFTLPDTLRQSHALHDFVGKGHYVFIDFWASWCMPCRADIPNVKRAYDTLHTKGLTVISVSLDENKDVWHYAMAKDGMPWLQLSDLKGFRSEPAVTYGISAIPASLLIGPDGKIVATNLRGASLTERIAKLMGL